MHYLHVIRNSLIYLFIGLFFIFPRLQPICFGLAFILSLFTPSFRSSWKKSFLTSENMLFLALFLLSAISITYSTNLYAAWGGIELKLSFLLFPLFFPAILKSGSIKTRRVLEFAFISAFISFMILLTRAMLRLYNGEGTHVFFSSEFSFIVHPSYLAIMLNILLAILFYRLVIGKTAIKKILPPVILLILYIILISSKIGLIILFINTLMYIIIYAITNKQIIKSLLITISLVVCSYIAITSIPKLNNKFTTAYTEFFTPDTSGTLKSTGQRLVAWETTKEIIEDNWLKGVGIGDLRDELNASYSKNGYPIMNKKQLDSHQQFMQTWATLGIVGFLIICLIFIWLFTTSYKTKNFMLFMLTLNFLLFGLTESMFETQAGVLSFLAFFYLLTDKRLLRILRKKYEST